VAAKAESRLCFSPLLSYMLCSLCTAVCVGCRHSFVNIQDRDFPKSKKKASPAPQFSPPDPSQGSMQVQSTVHRHGGMRWRPLSVADVMTNLTEGESARRPAAADRPLLRLYYDWPRAATSTSSTTRPTTSSGPTASTTPSTPRKEARVDQHLFKVVWYECRIL